MARARYDLLGPVAGRRGLDVACGHGRVTRELARRGAQVTGADISGVTCNFGLSDIDDLDAAITGISAALSPDGFFTFSILHPCFSGGTDISGRAGPVRVPAGP